MKNQFKKDTLSGISWSAGSQVLRVILNLAITSILARLLLPEDYGLIGMITVATGFLLVLKDFGFGAALVQKKNVEELEYHSVFWLNVIMGIALAILIYFSSTIIADFYDEPLIIPVAKLMSLGFVLNSLTVVPNNILYKKLQFKNVFIVDLISTTLGGGVGILLAYYDWAYWSLVWKSLATQIASLVVVLYLSGFRPKMRFSKKALFGFSDFSLPLIADSSINYWVRNLDYLLIGKFLGKVELGFYTKAYTLMLLPVRQLSGTIKKVMFPSFSLIQDDIARIGKIYLKITAVVAFITFPLMGVMFSLSSEIILFLFGENWSQSIPIFRVLCLLGAFQSIATLSGNIYLARAKTKLMFKIGLFTRSVMILSMIAGLYYGGLMGLVYGYSIASSLMVILELKYVGKIIDLSLFKILNNLSPYFLFTALIIAILECMKYIIFLSNHFINIIVYSSIAAIFYIGATLLFKPKAYKELLQIIKERK